MIQPILGLRQCGVQGLSTNVSSRAEDNRLHGVFRSNPRPAAGGPSRAIVKTELQPQPLRFVGRVFEQVQPLRAEVGGWTFGVFQIDVEKLRFLNANFFHRLKIGGDAGFGDIAVDPMPPRTSLGSGRWVLKTI